MPDVSPSTPFLDRLSQRLKGQRSSTSLMKSTDTNLPDENPKRKKKFLDKFIQKGSQADKMRGGLGMVMELGKKK